MNELITVHHEQGNYVVGMEVDDVAYILFESPYEHEAVGVQTLMTKAVNHLLVFEAEKRNRDADAAHHAVTGE